MAKPDPAPVVFGSNATRDIVFRFQCPADDATGAISRLTALIDRPEFCIQSVTNVQAVTNEAAELPSAVDKAAPVMDTAAAFPTHKPLNAVKAAAELPPIPEGVNWAALSPALFPADQIVGKTGNGANNVGADGNAAADAPFVNNSKANTADDSVPAPHDAGEAANPVAGPSSAVAKATHAAAPAAFSNLIDAMHASPDNASKDSFPLDPDDQVLFDAWLRKGTPPAFCGQDDSAAASDRAYNEFYNAMGRIQAAEVPAAKAVGGFGGLPTFTGNLGKMWEEVVFRRDRDNRTRYVPSEPNAPIRFVKIKDLAISMGGKFSVNFMGYLCSASLLEKPFGLLRWELELGNTPGPNANIITTYVHPDTSTKLKIGAPFPGLTCSAEEKALVMVLNADHLDPAIRGAGKTSAAQNSSLFISRELNTEQFRNLVA